MTMNSSEPDPNQPDDGSLIELSIDVDAEAAEAVSELFNRYNGGGYAEDSVAGEAGGGGAIIEATGFDDFEQPLENEHKLVVKTYLKAGKRGTEIRRKIEEGLWFLSRIYPLEEPQIRQIKEEDWAHAWKKFYKPIRIGHRILLKPAWEEVQTNPDDLIIELEPGMAFGTGMHPTTRLCMAAMETYIQPGHTVLDVGTGSGILAVLAARLGACRILGTDIDSLAVEVARENLARNGLSGESSSSVRIEQGSIPRDSAGTYSVVIVNILAEVIVKLFNAEHDDVPLSEPLARTGYLILSGILAEKAAMVTQAAARHGLTVIERLQEEDWVALIAQRKS